MKKLFWVNILLLLILLVSCASLPNNSLTVDTALNLANKQVELNQLEDALETYNEALSYGHDAKLLYNKSIVQAMQKDYKGAIDTALLGKKLYKKNAEFYLALGQYYFYNNEQSNFINYFNQYLKLNNADIDAKVLFAKLCYEGQLYDKAYEKALNLWNEQVYRKDIINILNAINPEEWSVLSNLF